MGLLLSKVLVKHHSRKPLAVAARSSHHHRNTDYGSGRTFFKFPPLRGNILLVGDGDFAYSVACARANQSNGSSARITATSFDSKKEVVGKYSHAKKNIDFLIHSSNVSVKHNINAIQPGSLGGNRVWDSIVWNFPYPSSRTPTHPSMSATFRKFFQNAVPSLKSNGIIYITLGINQAEKPMWGLKDLAGHNGLEVYSVVTFKASNICGYEPKRSYNDQKIPNFESCTYELRVY